MKCPHCEHEFELTWKRFLLSPRRNHICPKCQKKSKLDSKMFFQKPIASIFLIPVAMFVLTAAISILINFLYPVENRSQLFEVVLIILLLSFVIIGKTADSKYSKLQKID